MKRAVLFVGQGSQYTNMGIDFLNNDKAENLINKATKILGYDIRKILENENGELNNTLYTQPIVALITIIMYERFLEYGIDINGFLGFSLGEYVALYASGIYDFESIIRIIDKRAKLMNEASTKNQGGMAAVLNANLSDIERICNEVSKENYVTIANYNSKNQIVISGTSLGIEQASKVLKELGVKRVLPLNVSGAFHSNLMSEAGILLKTYLKSFKTNENEKECFMNVTGKPLIYDELLDNMEQQIKSPVKFYQSIEEMINNGYQEFIEIGPGNVLTQLIKKNYPEVKTFNINKLTDLEILEGDGFNGK
ncbi:ACP S-malonyltransferase [Haploplasma axanthum]|uniref:Malonyl CoA-acyl carrier protein transacylase n=1 Tax=Haploplasma axanthum TaxID=29552 RepID=A0A449BEV2_HAPAX|nr:ACP S-malonyltransferase [Haploplasma axanthum]VEU80979.1 Malonyl CoA-acyl carrier protein transacylase [Haploplasma axanthum]